MENQIFMMKIGGIVSQNIFHEDQYIFACVGTIF